MPINEASRFDNIKSFLLGRKGYRYFLCLFLFPVFFVFHGNNENFGIIPNKVVVSVLLKYVIITFGVIILNLLWFRTTQKGFVFAFYILALFFFFGAVYDTLNSFFPGKIVSSYSFLLPAILVITVTIYWLIRRTTALSKLIRYLQVLVLLFCAIEVFYAAWYSISGRTKMNDLSADSVNPIAQVACGSKELPDIYFIVFDGYTSSRLLKTEFSFSNDHLDSMLSQHGFFTSYSSKSNYNFTAFSLGSTFNLDYYKSGVEDVAITPKTVMQAVNTMRHNRLVQFLAGKGYVFRNYGRFEMDHMPSEKASFFDYYYNDLIDKQTLYERIRRDIGWRLSARNIFTGKFRVPERYIKDRDAHLARNRDNFNDLLKELSATEAVPRFVYTHLMLPHEPFYLAADGTLVPDSAIIKNTVDERAGYIAQVTYSNKLLEQLIARISGKSSRPLAIIVEGDHGYRFWDEKNLHKEFPNLNSYYFSDGDYSALYDGISPVNSFRVILNKYFCQQLPMVKDSTVYLKKPGQ